MYETSSEKLASRQRSLGRNLRIYHVVIIANISDVLLKMLWNCEVTYSLLSLCRVPEKYAEY
jgi:hypothetical protein